MSKIRIHFSPLHQNIVTYSSWKKCQIFIDLELSQTKVHVASIAEDRPVFQLEKLLVKFSTANLNSEI